MLIDLKLLDETLEAKVNGGIDQNINISKLEIKNKSIHLINKSEISVKNLDHIVGKISGTFKNLNFINYFLEKKIECDGSFDLSSTGNKLIAKLNTNKLKIDKISFNNINAQIETNPISLNVTVKSSTLYGNKINNLTLISEQEKTGQLNYKLSALIENFKNALLLSSGSVFYSPKNINLKINDFSVNNLTTKLRLVTPASIHYENDNINCSIPSLTFNDREFLRLGFKKNNKQIDCSLYLKDLPVSLFNLVGYKAYKFGTISTDFTINGSPNSPNIIFKGECKNIGKKLHNIKSHCIFSGIYKNNRFTADIDFPNFVGIFGRINLDIGCQVTLFPFHVDVYKNEYLKMLCTLKSDLSVPMNILLPDGMECWGVLNSNLNITGTPSSPKIDGQLNLKDGGFEQISSGTYVKNINILAKTNNNGQMLIKASATDDSDGKAFVTGNIIRQDSQSIPVLDCLVNFDNFKIIDEDDLIVSVKGDSYLKGGLDCLHFTGKLDMPYVLVDIDTTYSDSKGDLQVLENGKHIDVFETPEIKVSLPFKCNVALNCQKLHLKGKLLDSVWYGDVKLLGGYDKNAALSGVLKLREGHFCFLERNIPIKVGTISYSEHAPFVPVVNMHASKDINIAKVTANIKQTSSSVVFNLNSNPQLPLETIFSYLLFNKAQYNLTILEALQVNGVVSAVKEQSNKTFKLLESVEQQDLSSDLSSYNNPSSSNISLGKYVGENIYLSIENDTTKKVAFMKVHIVFTKNVSGQINSLGEFGLGWQRRY